MTPVLMRITQLWIQTPPMHQSPPRSAWSFRLALVCLAAVSVSLPMAWISLAKFLVFVFCLAYLIRNHIHKQSDPALKELWTPRILLTILLIFALSLVWTEGDPTVALLALVKHSKMLEILVLICLIRTAQEARLAMMAFTAGQVFLLLSSWLMVAGVPIPWNRSAIGLYVVFSTYLDQSIIFATTAAIYWHLGSDRLWPRWLAGLLAAAALINVLLLLEGRTGYIVALTVLSLAAMWAMPKSMRMGTVIATPIVTLCLLYFGSTQVQERLSKIIHESQTYASQGASASSNESSSGWRLNAWFRSIEAIQENPWRGHGVGSWTVNAKKHEGSSATKVFGEGNASNPHQEYLLWGVELGVGGLLLLLGLIGCFIRDALQFKTSIARALISVTSAMAVACLFNSTLYDALIGDFFCTALGLLMALGIRDKLTPSAQAIAPPESMQLKAAE